MKLIPRKLNQNKLILGLLIIFSLIVLVTRIIVAKKLTGNHLPNFNFLTLSQYNGIDVSKPVLLALDGYVYDVSPGRDEFYAVGKPYHDLVGKDSSQLLHLVGADIIKRKYQVVGTYCP